METILESLEKNKMFGTIDRLKRNVITIEDAQKELADFSIPKSGISLEEAQIYLANRTRNGVFGLTWDEIERKQGGKLRRNRVGDF